MATGTTPSGCRSRVLDSCKRRFIANVAIAPPFTALNAPDVDGLAGLAFPSNVVGTNVYLPVDYAGHRIGSPCVVSSHVVGLEKLGEVRPR